MYITAAFPIFVDPVINSSDRSFLVRNSTWSKLDIRMRTEVVPDISMDANGIISCIEVIFINICPNLFKCHDILTQFL